ncbi:MAG: hypothetical protein H6821_12325 [Planctomycetaceae bacterium]|nr:hypothetical protein [Planctomycetaceae bacterium]
MKRSAVEPAIEEVARLTNVRVRPAQLFIESIIYSNCRLKLAVVRGSERIDLVRVPSNYLFAHCGLAFAIVFSGLLIFMEGLSEVSGACVAALVAAGGGYGLTMWHNRRAEQQNPILSYDTQRQRLFISSKQIEVGRGELLFMLALSSIPFKANKPNGSSSELKLVFNYGGQVDSAVLAKVSTSWVKGFDAEILPFVEALGILHLHADRDIGNGSYTIARIA